MAISALPAAFNALILNNCLAENQIRRTDDGFFVSSLSIAHILQSRGIDTFPNAQNENRMVDRFFDDWYLFSVPDGENAVYSLLKMREQEFDAAEDIPADADTPGVTIPFIAFNVQTLLDCLQNPAKELRKKLNDEINRTVAYGGQKHHPALKKYFSRAQARAPYLIADMYTAFLAAQAENGLIPVPAAYTARKHPRLMRFIEKNNAAAGRIVCDHRHIFLHDPPHLTKEEKLALLATHTANTSLHSFAAEVRFHAQFLFPVFRWPFLQKSPYNSVLRADMTVDNSMLHNLFPFYHPCSASVRAQKKHHPTA